MKILLKKLNNPEKKLKCIHVAGTNGKGSVCAMLNSILQEADYKVGMYTSPHLKKFNERIRINNRLILDKEVAEYYLKVKKYVTNQSFFEITTTMAFLYFVDKKVDIAVLEVGMGGRLDSTNLIKPLISVITNIGKEHEKFLGDSLSKIAYEKSGIIKEKIPVITGATGIALKTIKKIAKKKNSQLSIIKKSINNNYNGKNKIKLNLRGNFQRKNAAIAVKTIEILNNENIKINNKILKINKNNINNGLRKAKWPARFQFIKKNIIIDTAHNEDGFRVLFNELKSLKYKKLIMVVGFSKDKNIKTISKIINSNIKNKKIILIQANNERALTIKDAIPYFKDMRNLKIINSSKEALNYAKKIAKKDDLILITGSIYLVGELI